jgi:RimJ/RimL family protein N-acetyltransferase
LITNNEIVGYCAVDINNEPAYQKIEGAWQTNGDFVVFHRVAIAKEYIGKGLASTMFKCIEHYALENTINSIKADTNFDNAPMLYLFKKLGYRYCGQVHIRNSPRRAYEKVLNLKQ